MFQLLLAIIYTAFISLGLPDALLGSAWPVMYREFGVKVSYAGIISMIIALGTVVSSLQSDRLTKKFGTGRVTAASVALTAFALFGFSLSHSFYALVFLALPYGLGAGSVDASLNNYVALHYKSRHMSWLHCMWGVGAAAGPHVMGFMLAHGNTWNAGYRTIAVLQTALTALLVFSLPLWRRNDKNDAVERISGAAQASVSDIRPSVPKTTDPSAFDSANTRPLSLKEIINLPGAKAVMLSFFCYSAVEQTSGLWAASYAVLYNGVSTDIAARYASLVYLGITVGRALGGFLSMYLSDTQMVRTGEIVILAGVILLFVPFGNAFTLSGFALIGLGCAPVFPSLIHATPHHFGANKSQAVIGVQMASAYIGTCSLPPLFGFIANRFGISLLPVYVLFFCALMIASHERLIRLTERRPE
ncbi:transporter, major facilitator family protein [Treponema socranskii subsp. socranskii VPI DR56BR1116 = ATCC 35536]|uniref:Transporter, major facilitator family protein n=1 Tax=Treponema socranskii subsp. socranskii VPI DR56BR1116 = ATCC 35536 TaxID=1125725 RepID=U2KRS5_TRESO|nr:MFS transporter [Treponema socranskii]ERF59377.1 transporter, major facilitator family protein [Treponema socranskii subsp. socranskii VPI DR56BR1116 = ATCC 35536]ERK01187.1 transporter, major facilitator family protein [Treponema socranskii subsp. socranskii VPI DR56BR1116 = ATCC 35536]